MGFEDMKIKTVSDTDKVENNDLETEETASNEQELLESETGISKSILKKITENAVLRKAFFTVALSIGLLTGRDLLAQNNSEKDFHKESEIENTIPENEETSLEDNIEEFREYIKNNEYFAEFPNSLISWAAAVEKPTNYQAEKIVELHNYISEKASLEKFNNLAELVSFINMEIDSGFSNKGSYIKFKDIFPEEEGSKPKAKFDCDSRAIMVSSILQNMGYKNSDFSMCEMEGHMIMYLKKDNVYFELTTNKITELSKEETAQINEIDQAEKYFSHLFANEGVALALESEGNLFYGEYTDKEKREQAIASLEKSIELDPGNLTAKLNLIKMLSRFSSNGDDKLRASILNRELLKDLVYNYHNIDQNDIKNREDVIMKASPETGFTSQEKLDFKELSIKAIKESKYLRNKFEKHAELSYYIAKNYNEAISINKILLESLPENEKKSFTANLYRENIANSYFNNHDFSKYIAEVDDIINDIYKCDDKHLMIRNIRKLEAQKTVADILAGKLIIDKSNVEEIVSLYEDDDILGPVISGKESWRTNDIDGVEMLRHWDGYDNLKQMFKDVKEAKKIRKELNQL